MIVNPPPYQPPAPFIVTIDNELHAVRLHEPGVTLCGIDMRDTNTAISPSDTPCRACTEGIERRLPYVPESGEYPLVDPSTSFELRKFAIAHAVELVRHSMIEFEEAYSSIINKLIAK